MGNLALSYSAVGSRDEAIRLKEQALTLSPHCDRAGAPSYTRSDG